MIARYPGKCVTCGKPITPGKDIYDVEEKKNYHVECPADLFAFSQAEQLADKLGFIRPGEPIPGSWQVWKLSDADRG